jgi:PAP2 family protein
LIFFVHFCKLHFLPWKEVPNLRTTDVIASIIISYFIAKFVHKKIFGNKERIRKIRLFSYDRKTNIGKKDIIANTLNYKNKNLKTG